MENIGQMKGPCSILEKSNEAREVLDALFGRIGKLEDRLNDVLAPITPELKVDAGQLLRQRRSPVFEIMSEIVERINEAGARVGRIEERLEV